MFTSGVVLEGLGLSRSWSLLAVFGFAQLVGASGCVREVNVMPDGQSDDSTSTQEQGPGDVGGSTQDTPTNSQGPGETSSAPVVTDSGTGSVTSGIPTSTDTSSTTETLTEEEDTGDPNAACVQDGEDRQCVPKAPVGWYGPVGLLQGSDVKDTRVCKPHSDEIDELFDEVTAPAIECKGCAAALTYPDSLRVQAVEYSSSTCGESDEIARSPIGDWFCHDLEPDGDGKGSHWKVQVPKPEGDVKCVGADRSSTKRPIEIKNYFRGCQVERKGTCEGVDDVCTKKGVGPTCVYRMGDMECPSAYSGKRQVLYNGFEDTRACTECEAVMKKEGSWQIQGKVSFYSAANCISSSKKKSFDLADLTKRCDAEPARIKKEWNFARLELDQPKFDGVCETKGWEPEGEVKGKNPVTVCCRGITE